MVKVSTCTSVWFPFRGLPMAYNQDLPTITEHKQNTVSTKSLKKAIKSVQPATLTAVGN